MILQLLSCDAQRPDRRAISNALSTYASNMDEGLARELTGILLDGSPVEIEVEGKTTSSAFRALRKLKVDYEIMD